jgi:hypothetical protein
LFGLKFLKLLQFGGAFFVKEILAFRIKNPSFSADDAILQFQF